MGVHNINDVPHCCFVEAKQPKQLPPRRAAGQQASDSPCSGDKWHQVSSGAQPRGDYTDHLRPSASRAPASPTPRMPMPQAQAFKAEKKTREGGKGSSIDVSSSTWRDKAHFIEPQSSRNESARCMHHAIFIRTKSQKDPLSERRIYHAISFVQMARERLREVLAYA